MGATCATRPRSAKDNVLLLVRVGQGGPPGLRMLRSRAVLRSRSSRSAGAVAQTKPMLPNIAAPRTKIRNAKLTVHLLKECRTGEKGNETLVRHSRSTRRVNSRLRARASSRLLASHTFILSSPRPDFPDATRMHFASGN